MQPAPHDLKIGPAPSRGSMAAFVALLMGSDSLQRRCIGAISLSALVYLVCTGLLAYGSAQGLFPPEPVRVLAVVMLATPLTFYVIVRSGLNLRFAEPTLAFPQGLAGQTLVAGAYAFSGPVHAGNLILLALVMIFGMFDMQVRHARLLAAYSIVLMGCVMLWRSHTDPLLYPATMELMYFVLILTVLIAISQLSVLMSTMRQRLKSQRSDLQKALAHIQEMATHDDLTGLANRRHMLDLLDQHARRHARGGPSFYVAMADLDFFKKINDSLGHAAGDDALRTFARQAQSQLRTTDIIGRWGGEEFLLLMPETPPGDPNVGLERLRTALANTAFSAEQSTLRLKFSAGLSRYREGEAVGDTIERADRAVYAAKAAGRDRTVAL